MRYSGFLLILSLIATRVPAAVAGAGNAGGFTPGQISASMVKQMRQAWELAGRGHSSHEAAVVIVARGQGEYEAVLAHDPDRYRSMQLEIPSGAVAIFHTHPNFTGGEPSPQDRRIADQLGIPNYTLTDRGVWVYDPATRSTSRLMYKLSWLEVKNWDRQFSSDRPVRP